MMNENKDSRYNLVVVLLIISIFANLWFNSGQTRELKNQIQNLNSKINSLSNQLANIDYEIEAAQDQANNLVNFFDYGFASINMDEKSVSVEVKADLKETQPGSEIYLSISDEADNITRYRLDPVEGLSYRTELDLGIFSNYAVNVIEDYNGSLRQLNTDSYMISLGEQFEFSRLSQRRNETGTNSKSIYFNIHFEVNALGLDELEMASATFVLEDRQSRATEGIIFQEDIIDQLMLYDDLTDEDKTKVMAGELLIDRPRGFGFGTSAVAEELAVEEMVMEKQEGLDKSLYSLLVDTSETKYYIFQKVFIYDEYPNLNLKEGAESIHGYIQLEFKDGAELRLY